MEPIERASPCEFGGFFAVGSTFVIEKGVRCTGIDMKFNGFVFYSSLLVFTYREGIDVDNPGVSSSKLVCGS
jgi:hypothetical protein